MKFRVKVKGAGECTNADICNRFRQLKSKIILVEESREYPGHYYVDKRFVNGEDGALICRHCCEAAPEHLMETE